MSNTVTKRKCCTSVVLYMFMGDLGQIIRWRHLFFAFDLRKSQAHAKQGHQMKMLHECRAGHALCVLWDVESDDDVYFLDLSIGKIKVRSS